MKATINIGDRSYSADLGHGRSIAIPLRFNGAQPNSYDVPDASSAPFESASFVGDTRRGGSCNFETVTLTPHCNGTHTECLGHITDQRISVEKTLSPGLLPATLISITPEAALHSPESYLLVKDEEDYIITANALKPALESANPAFLNALVIRTLPNPQNKCTQRYMERPAAFFSVEAIQLLIDRDVQHILVDIPSLDRAFDEGQLSVHHLFWNMEQGSHIADEAAFDHKTITEFIYVPDDIPDGRYLLDLQIAPFVMDAAPSRPVLFPLHD